MLRLAEAEAQTPFDLTRGPMLRTKLLRLSIEEHVLLVTSHRIAFDERSSEIFDRELGALYDAYVEGRPSPLAPLPIQYREFSRVAGRASAREGLRGAARVLEAPAPGNATLPQSARKPPEAPGVDFSSGNGGRPVWRGPLRGSPRARGKRGGEPFRNAARGLSGPSPATLGPRRFRRGLTPDGPPPSRFRSVDRTVRQQPRLSRQSLGGPELSRAASPGPGGGGRGRHQPGCPLREVGGRAQSRKDPELPAAVSGRDDPPADFPPLHFD